MRMRTLFATIYTAMVLPSLLLAPPAEASPVADYAAASSEFVCSAIAEQPYISTVDNIVHLIAVDTRSFEVAGDVVDTVVRKFCPWNRATLERWTRLYMPQQSRFLV